MFFIRSFISFFTFRLFHIPLRLMLLWLIQKIWVCFRFSFRLILFASVLWFSFFLYLSLCLSSSLSFTRSYIHTHIHTQSLSSSSASKVIIGFFGFNHSSYSSSTKLQFIRSFVRLSCFRHFHSFCFKQKIMNTTNHIPQPPYLCITLSMKIHNFV